MAVKKKQRNKESDLLADLSDYIVEILSSEIKFSEDEANLLMKEGWKYLSVNTSSHPTSYILCRTTTREQE